MVCLCHVYSYYFFHFYANSWVKFVRHFLNSFSPPPPGLKGSSKTQNARTLRANWLRGVPPLHSRRGMARKTCECGANVKDEMLRGFYKYTKLDQHRDCKKHHLMLELKAKDPESWKLALDKDTENVVCPCGQRVRRWTFEQHQRSQTHLMKMQKGWVYDRPCARAQCSEQA